MSNLTRSLQSHSHGFALVLGLLLVAPTLGFGQERQNPYGEWRYQSGDAWGTRYSPVDQIDASNFADLEVAWEWRADNSPSNSKDLVSPNTLLGDCVQTNKSHAPLTLAL